MSVVLIRNPIDGANALQLIFSLRRGDLDFLAVELLIEAGARTLFTSADPTMFQLNGRTLKLFLGKIGPAYPGLGVGLMIAVHLRSTGERPRVVAKDDWVRDTAAVDVATLVLPFTHHQTTWPQIDLWRIARSKAEPNAVVKHAKLFFSRLERETSLEAEGLWANFGGALNPATRKNAISLLMALLVEGIRKRFDTGGASYTGAGSAIHPSAREISGVFRQSWAWACGAVLDSKLDELCDAFDLFVRGQLVLFDPAHDAMDGKFEEYKVQSAQPDSPNLFLFAELAQLCVDLNVDTAFWNALLPTLVYVQKVYYEHYAPLPDAGLARTQPYPLPWSARAAFRKRPPHGPMDAFLVAMRAERGAFLGTHGHAPIWTFNVQRRVERAPG